MYSPSAQDLRELITAGITMELSGLPPREMIDIIVGGLDELCAMANDEEQWRSVEKEMVGLGQIISRAQLVLSFLYAKQPANNVVYLR